MDKPERPLKILHIGNIANNAYNNAKLLNRYGHDNDVICYDYYHVMGTPEWEDADFKVGPKDDFYPNWEAVKTNGYERPRWFAQGPLISTMRYLMARRQGRQLEANLRWRFLGIYRWLISFYGFRELLLAFPHLKSRVFRWGHSILGFEQAIFQLPQRVVHVTLNLSARLGPALGFLAIPLPATLQKLLDKQVALFYGKPLTGQNSNERAFTLLADILLQMLIFPAFALALLAMISISMSASLFRLAYQLIKVLASIFVRMNSMLLATIYGLLISLVRLSLWVIGGLRRMFGFLLDDSSASSVGKADHLNFDDQVGRLLREWSEVFPDRKDKLCAEDLEPYRNVATYWNALFTHYDVIVAYSTDPILPMICGRKYLSMEHGTLRSIPFEETAQGRLTALAYAKSVHCFVTNFDCLDNARILAGERVTAINHPYDEDHGLNTPGIEQARLKLLKKLDADFLFFFPTRHDWVEGTGYADKANDVFLRAFVALRKSGLKVGLICCSWGNNVEQSAMLLRDSGMKANVKWVQPLGIVEFDRMSGAADVVVDQFKLGAFGGVLFKAMSMGAPICTFLDESLVGEQYAEAPPVINCRSQEEIFNSMAELIAETQRLKEMSENSRNWIKKYHNALMTVTAQLPHLESQYERTTAQ